jgi:hypothetical protein
MEVTSLLYGSGVDGGRGRPTTATIQQSLVPTITASHPTTDPLLQERDPTIQVFLIDPPGSSLYNKASDCCESAHDDTACSTVCADTCLPPQVKRGVLYTREEAEGKRLRNPVSTEIMLQAGMHLPQRAGKQASYEDPTPVYSHDNTCSLTPLLKASV